MPDAATIDRTEPVMSRLGDIARSVPGVKATFAISGFSLLTGVNQTNAGTMFVPLIDFEERAKHPEQSSGAILARLMREYSQVQEGFALVLQPPPVRGIGTAGGFKLQVQDRTGRATPQQLQATAERLITEARANHELVALFSTFRANAPQLYANVDRQKAKMQDVPVTNIFEALQVYLGSLYVNDFNYLGRTYRVTAQADAPFRSTAAGLGQLKTRNRAGDIVPLGAVLEIKDTTGPDRINRYNLYQAADVNGSAAPGSSSGRSIAIMEDLARRTLPQGYGFDWTDLAYQENAAGNTAFLIFPLCVLFVWLVHSAEYESFALSTAIILIVPMCLLCGIAGVWLIGKDNNIFTQIGFVVLAGLSAKNAVLIVEFAKQQEEHGKHYLEAAVEASRLRLRPILMTSFAFILGVVPLVLAEGAGAEMRRALGTVVFSGMIGVTLFGIFLTPVFYVTIRWLTRRRAATAHARAARLTPVPAAAGTNDVQHSNQHGAKGLGAEP
jgi:multidrug efflux pump subunit AcrB